jgi:hypothetical protein
MVVPIGTQLYVNVDVDRDHVVEMQPVNHMPPIARVASGYLTLLSSRRSTNSIHDYRFHRDTAVHIARSLIQLV